MHIGMIHLSAGRFPPDIRVEKEIAALRAADFEVSVLCPRVDDHEPEMEELDNGVFVYRQSPPVCRFSAYRKLRTLWQHWTFRYSHQKRWIKEFLTRTQADVLHVHDLQMVPTTLKAARDSGVPVVADFHETMSAAIAAFRVDYPWPLRIFRALLVNTRAYRWHELQCARRCSKIIVVVEEGAEPFLKAGIPREKIVVIGNREDETTLGLPHPKVDPALARRYEGKWVATYVGGVSMHRGIDTVVKGVPMIAQKVPHFLLQIVGANDEAQQKLRSLAARCGAEKYVDILGWIPMEQCFEIIRSSQACLVPFNRFAHTEMAAPHKLFQYMGLGRPVVVSDCRALKRIVDAAGAGVVFRANDPHDFARAVIRLANDDQFSTRCGENGRRAALGPLSWKHEAAKLVSMYRDLEQQLQRSRRSSCSATTMG